MPRFLISHWFTVLLLCFKQRSELSLQCNLLIRGSNAKVLDLALGVWVLGALPLLSTT